jgi:hypothetical protein
VLVLVLVLEPVLEPEPVLSSATHFP